MKAINIDGEIGWDVEARDIREQLNAIAEEGETEVQVNISSPGGLVSEGLAIYNALKNFPGTVNTHITGLAASMASYIAMAGKRVTAEPNAIFMIHNSRMLAIGDYRVMFKAGKHLDSINNIIARAYAEKTGKPLDAIRAVMDEESYYYGDEIAAEGFVDEISGDGEPEDKAEAIAFAEAMVRECEAKVNSPEIAEKEMKTLAEMKLTEPVMKINGFDDKAKLKDEPWDKSESEQRWRDHAGVKTRDDLPNDKYDQRFVYVADPNSFTARNFPIWDYKGGEEFVNIAAVRNGLARVSQSNLSDNDKARVKGVLNKYLDKYKKQTGGKGMTYDELKNNHKELFDQVFAEGVKHERARVSDLIDLRAKFVKSHSQAVLDEAIKDGLDLAKTNVLLMAAEQAAQELEDEKKHTDDNRAAGNTNNTDDVPEMKDGIMTHPAHIEAVSKKIAAAVGLK